MANVYATKSGNWSDTTVWNTLALPATVDDVYSNNFTVYVDNSYQVISVNNIAAAGIAAGGGFILNNAVSLSANVGGGGSSGLACVRFLSAAPFSASLIGDLSALNVAITEPVAVANTNTGTLTVSGNSRGCSRNNTGAGTGAAYIRNSSTGTLNLIGTWFTNLITGGLYYCMGNTSTGTLNITGNITGGGSVANATCIYNAGTLNVLGNVTSSAGTGGGSRGIEGASTSIISITGNVVGGGGGSPTSSQTGISNSGALTVFGNVSGGFGTGANLSNGITHIGSLTTIYGNVVGSVGGNGYGIQNSTGGSILIFGDIRANASIGFFGVGNISVVGNVFGGTGSSIRGIQTTSTGTVNITGNIFGGSGSSAAGVFAQAASNVNIVGNVVAGTGSLAYGAENTATGYMQVNGIAIGNAFGLGSVGINSSPAIFGSQTGTTIIRGLSCGARGQWPTAGVVYIQPQSTSTATLETSAFQDVTFITSLSDGVVPPVSSVRLGTVYNLGDYRGTCAMPSVSSVLQGVAVDNFVGIAALQPQTIWNYSVLSATDVNSLGGRLKEVATVQSVGQQLTALN